MIQILGNRLFADQKQCGRKFSDFHSYNRISFRDQKKWLHSIWTICNPNSGSFHSCADLWCEVPKNGILSNPINYSVIWTRWNQSDFVHFFLQWLRFHYYQRRTRNSLKGFNQWMGSLFRAIDFNSDNSIHFGLLRSNRNLRMVVRFLYRFCSTELEC